jgi:hypothetical protein
MKTSPRQLGVVLVASAALLLASNQGRAQGAPPQSDYTNTFDTSTSTASWIYWYGLGFGNTPMTFDPTMDALNDPNSGSLQVSLPFVATNKDQAVFFGTFHNQYGYDGTTIYDGTKFTNITFDVHVDPSSPLSPAGDFGVLQVGLVRQGWPNGGTFDAGSPTIPASATNGWVRLNQTIDLTAAGLDAVAGVDFKYTSYSGYPTNPITFWIDNLDVHLAQTKQAPPKVIPTLAKPSAGLNLFSSGSNGDQYQRTNLKLQNTLGVGWLNDSGPVTYSLTITNFPNGALYPGYQAHLFITTGTPANNETDPDYAEGNLIFLDIHENADGTAYGAFRYKTNEIQGNTMVYGSGTLGVAGSSNILGKWSLTFSQNTNVTVTSPDGSTLQTNIPPDAAALFADPLNVYFGAQPNSPANFGQSVVLSSVAVTGVTTPVSDNFFADNWQLDTNSTWTIVAGDPSTVQLMAPDPGGLFIRWSLPDSGFGLQASTNLAKASSWVTLTGPDSAVGPLLSFSSAGSREVYLPSSVLGSNQAAFFRLNQQVFTKLQILMPGETNAPGTANGKIGTPTPEAVGVPFNVTVSAVDNAWHIVNSVDSIHLTSSDASATLPADAALASGTGTFSVTFNATGNFTVTAADVTDSTKAGVTGSSTLVTQ